MALHLLSPYLPCNEVARQSSESCSPVSGAPPADGRARAVRSRALVYRCETVCKTRRCMRGRPAHRPRWRARGDAASQWLRRVRMRSPPGHMSMIAAGSACIPLNASAVPMHGSPAAKLRRTLSLRPAPKRNGATVRRIRSSTAARSSTRPNTSIPGRASSRRKSSERPLPTIIHWISGALRQTNGMISCTSHRTASRFGACSNEPMNATPDRSANRVSIGAGGRAHGMTLILSAIVASR